ncbi:MAG: hypothetical protein K0R39_2791 [Symbiobacteriaceae bacterium]|jgi:hypothetical protein|nr:hypothetical protein [Symbiobacteriaceae bacterium]
MLLDLRPGRPPLPKEHGGWAMMLTPPVVAVLSAGLDLLGLLAVLGWAVAYCLRGPVEVLRGEAPTGRAGMTQASPEVARFWLLLFGLIAALLLGPVVAVRPKVVVPLFAALAALLCVLALVHRGQTRSILAGTLASAGLMVGGPLYYVAADGAAGLQGWTLGLACGAFFVGSIFRVKTLARERRSAGFRWLSVLLHGTVAGAGVVAAVLGYVSWLTAASLLPALGWSVYGAVRAGGPVSLLVIGKGEQWLTIAFGLLLAAGLRISP